jgi:hypothetical protein
MATTIDYPTKDGLLYYADGSVYLRADNTTVWTYCSGKSYTCVSYIAEEQRFSNDGGLAYQFYGPFTGWISPGVWSSGTTSMWQTEFGYEKIVRSLTIA